jgi:hypothetical protein
MLPSACAAVRPAPSDAGSGIDPLTSIQPLGVSSRIIGVTEAHNVCIMK